MNTWPNFLIILAVSSALTMGQALASSPAASLTGTVTDPSGAIVADARIDLTNVATGLKKTTTTQQDGRYKVEDLPGGEYDQQASAPGHSITRPAHLSLEPGTQLTANITLQVGTISTTIEVTSPATVIEKTTARVQSMIDAAQIDALPTMTRPMWSNILVAAPIYGHGLIAGFRNANVTIDGINVQDSFIVSGSVSQIPVPADTTAEFTTLADSTAGMPNTGSWHASRTDHNTTSYYYFRNTIAPQGITLSTGLAGSMGGPIVPNKFFYFSNYEGARETRSVSVRSVYIPSVLPKYEYRPTSSFVDSTSITGTSKPTIPFATQPHRASSISSSAPLSTSPPIEHPSFSSLPSTSGFFALKRVLTPTSWERTGGVRALSQLYREHFHEQGIGLIPITNFGQFGTLSRNCCMEEMRECYERS